MWKHVYFNKRQWIESWTEHTETEEKEIWSIYLRLPTCRVNSSITFRWCLADKRNSACMSGWSTVYSMCACVSFLTLKLIPFRVFFNYSYFDFFLHHTHMWFSNTYLFICVTAFTLLNFSNVLYMGKSLENWIYQALYSILGQPIHPSLLSPVRFISIVVTAITGIFFSSVKHDILISHR